MTLVDSSTGGGVRQISGKDLRQKPGKVTALRKKLRPLLVCENRAAIEWDEDDRAGRADSVVFLGPALSGSQRGGLVL
jgi:hypothetical protein